MHRRYRDRRTGSVYFEEYLTLNYQLGQIWLFGNYSLCERHVDALKWDCPSKLCFQYANKQFLSADSYSSALQGRAWVIRMMIDDDDDDDV